MKKLFKTPGTCIGRMALMATNAKDSICLTCQFPELQLPWTAAVVQVADVLDGGFPRWQLSRVAVDL